MVYAFIGKSDIWNESDTTPDPIKSINRERIDSEDILAMKRVLYKDLVVVASYNQWDETHDTVYDMYDDSIDMFGKTYTVVTGDDYRVYKCISNGDGAKSTIQPTYTSVDSMSSIGSDGYQWKYMYSMKSATTSDTAWDWVTDPSPSVVNVNGLPAFMPVINVTSRTDNDTQWDVRKAAIDGAIHRIEVTGTVAGSETVTLYKDSTTEWDVGFNASSNSAGDGIVISNPGKGINTIYKISVGSTEYEMPSEVIRPIYSPPGGHGSDPIKELMATYVYINASIDQDVQVPNNQYRKVGLIYDPFRQTRTDTTDNKLTHIDESNELVLGEKLGKSMAIATDYLEYSGHITYVDNRLSFGTKQVGQTVSLMVILSF